VKGRVCRRVRALGGTLLALPFFFFVCASLQGPTHTLPLLSPASCEVKPRLKEDAALVGERLEVEVKVMLECKATWVSVGACLHVCVCACVLPLGITLCVLMSHVCVCVLSLSITLCMLM
jgi:hypothetical protein